MPEQEKHIKIVFHIGMGKTGSSSVQAALEMSGDALREQRTKYIGMWFDAIDPSFYSHNGHDKFTALDAESMITMAKTFWLYLEEEHSETGINQFIYSNEAMQGQSESMSPFLSHLQQLGADISIICYVRDPVKWLPSAYKQWYLKHKTTSGPLESYRDSARQFIKWYQGPLDWQAAFPSDTIVRNYDACEDVISDFARTLSLEIPPRKIRANEQESAEKLLLQAFFASRCCETYLPDFFEKAVKLKPENAPKVLELLKEALDYSDTPNIIAENSHMFEAYRDRIGFDPRSNTAEPAPSLPDVDDVRSRLLEVVTDLSLGLAIRVRELEETVAGLDQKIKRPSLWVPKVFQQRRK